MNEFWFVGRCRDGDVTLTLPAGWRVAQDEASQFRAELDKRNGVESVRSELRSDKTIDFLIENAKIK